METWILYILAGLASGIISSMFGVGSGVLMVPILVLGFSFGQKSAQGMSLFIMIIKTLPGTELKEPQYADHPTQRTDG